ncbi:MAG: hypothetical protein ABID54_01925 [Pseudomonadota bacterium]
MSLGEICWSSGDPSRVSRKGKASPSETGRGKYSPPASPARVTAEAASEGIKGFTLKSQIIDKIVVS